jgi:penicillin amidase
MPIIEIRPIPAFQVTMTPLRIVNPRRHISIARDAHGVPHVVGSTWLDALYGLGYMHATDRATQMLFGRAVALGRAAERIADRPELIETDRFFRRVGLYLHLEREVSALDDRAFQQLTAYCEGVNDGLKAAGRSLPMWAVGFQPAPWNQEAVLLIGNLLAFGGLAVSQMENERLLVELIHAGVSDEGLRELFRPRLDDVDFTLLREVKIMNKLSDQALELLTDLPRLAGSNAWVVAPQRSATGGAMLASDPHLEINRLPAIWYEAVLKWDHNYVMGATLPGCPLFAVARTRDLAWGVTYMKGDTVDYFIEDIRRGGATAWQYRRGREWHDFSVRQEAIARKTGEELLLNVYHNDVGTLECDPESLDEGYHLSMNWTGYQPGGGRAIVTWLEMIAAAGAKAGMDLARDCPQPTLNWVFADREGHIGLQGCGRFPRRAARNSGLVPVPAWDASNHWRGLHGSDVLPRIYDPPEGFIATANEDIRTTGGPQLVTQPVPAYRKQRINERLAELRALTLEDMQELQYDLVSIQARELLRVLLPHLPDGPLRDRLANWDCRYSPESKEASLFQRLYVNVLMEIFGHDGGIGWRRTLYLVSRIGFSIMVVTACDRLLKQEQSFWWRERDKGELIRRAAERTAGEPDIAWSGINHFHFADRFFGTHRVGRLLGYATPQFPMPGCFATVFQGHVQQTAGREITFAPSYHFVADLRTDEAWSNLPGGPSESRFSRFYKSDLALWFEGEYKRLAVS